MGSHGAQDLCTSHTCANFRKQVNSAQMMMMTKMVPIGVNDHFSLFAEIIRDKPIDFLELIFLFPKTPFFGWKTKGKKFFRRPRRGFCFLCL